MPIEVVGAAGNAETGTSATSLTIARPPGVAKDDILVARVRHRFALSSAPAGWNLVNLLEVATGRNQGLWWRRVQAGETGEPGEPASYTWVQGAAEGRIAGDIVALRGAHPTAPIHAWAVFEENTSTQQITTPSVTVTIPGCMILRLWSAHAAGGISVPAGSGIVERYANAISTLGRPNVTSGTRLQSDSGATGTAIGVAASASSATPMSYTVAIAPAPSAPSVPLIPLWNGTSWEYRPYRRWTGTEWVGAVRK